MPKIPDYTALGGTPSMNSGRHVPSAREADMSARYAGLAHLGAAIAGIGEQRQKQEDALDILKAETKHKSDLTEIERDLSNNPDYDQHDPIFQDRASKSAAEASQLIRNPQAREHWQLRAGLENEGARAGVVRRAEALGKQQRVTDLDGVLNDLQKSYADPNATEKQRQDAQVGIDNAITLAQKSGLMTPRQAQKVRQRVLSSSQEIAIQQRIAHGEDFETIIRDIEGGVPEAQPVDDRNLKAADETLKLTPQEQNLYQRHLTNLTGEGGVDNTDGTRSTLGQTTISANGKFYNIPTVWDGKSLSDQDATDRATKEGLDSFPAYDTKEQAGERLQQLDSYMEKDTQAFLQGRKGAQSKTSLTERIAGVSTSLETGSKDPLKGVANVSRDSGGTRSYGNFGLNSQEGGSIYGFQRDYGEQFGLTAKPGTREFDDQWKNAAKAAPVELREAEMQWFEGHILPNIETDLTSIGISKEMANDPRVKAYFADRMVQFGEKSIQTYQGRISTAADKADGNPVAFLQNLTEADRANYKTDFRRAIASGVYGKTGSDTRLNGRLRAALGVGAEGEEPHYSGPYPDLTPSQRQRLLNVAKVANRAMLQQGVRDATAEIRRTGQAPRDEKGRTALDRAKLSLTKNEAAKAELDWREAEAEYKAVSPLANLPYGEAVAHIDKLTPGHELSDEHYAIADKVQKKADAEWKKIQKQRETDPAAAVENSPEVNEAKHTLTVAGNRVNAAQRNEMLIEARRNAQERLGIPKWQQRLLTETEAADLLQIPKNPDDPSEIDAAINDAAKRAEERYGKYAMDALDSAIAVHIKGSKDTRQAARDLATGIRAQHEPPPPPKPSFWQNLWPGSAGGGAPATGKSSKDNPTPPGAPQAVMPKPAQIQWLLMDPKNRQADFDNVFGPGATMRVLQAQELNQKQGVR